MTDEFVLDDYEREGVVIFRYEDKRFKALTDDEICHLYREWSHINYAAGWMTIVKGDANIKNFIDWTFTSPARLIKGNKDDRGT